MSIRITKKKSVLALTEGAAFQHFFRSKIFPGVQKIIKRNQRSAEGM